MDEFKKTCKRTLTNYPTSPCPQGDLGVSTKGDATGSCDWYVNSPQDMYCFWRWAARRSDQEGRMDAVEPKELRKLLGYTAIQLSETTQSALAKIKKSPIYAELAEIYDL